MTRTESMPSPLWRVTLAWVVAVAVIGVLIYLLASVLTPFLIAAIIGYILNPGVDWLSRRRVPRWLATTLMLILLIALVFLLVLIVVPVLQREFAQVKQKFPELLSRLQSGVAPKLSSLFGVDIEFNAESIRAFAAEHFNFESIGKSALAYLRVGSAAALSWLATAFLVPIVLFYLLIDWHMVWSKLQTLIPRGLHRKLGAMTGEVDAVLAQFLRGQLLVMVVLAVYYSAALSIARFDGALPIGILTGLLVFIPYVGFASGLVLASLAALLQFGNLYGFAAVAVVYGVGQILETVVLVPRLVGTNIGLHPLAVIFALLAFGELFGFFGILLALPVSAILVVALKHVKRLYFASDFYRGDDPVVAAATAALARSTPAKRTTKRDD